MPYMTNEIPCKCCREKGKEFRLKWHSINQKYYLQSSCTDCEKKKFQIYQKQNLENFRIVNRQQYLNRVGKLSRRSTLEMTPELRIEYSRQKSNLRCTRAKKARVSWDKELTDFIYKEANVLRKNRNTLTGFEWHIDHIIPLKGKQVCGLHTWNNFAVIPKVDNLRKGNNYSVHD